MEEQKISTLEDMEEVYHKLQGMETEMVRKYAMETNYLNQAMQETNDSKTKRLLDESQEAIKYFNIEFQEMIARMGDKIKRQRYEEEEREKERLKSERQEK